MDDTEQAAPEAPETSSDDASEGQPAQTVRVPNVSPNAKSGLDHTIIGSNALAGAGEQDTPDGDPDGAEGDDEDTTDEVPEDQEAALQWVAAAEDSGTARERADAVWAKHGDPEDTQGSSDLATALRSAVYGTGDPAATDGDPQTEQTETGDPATGPDGGQAQAANDSDPQSGEQSTGATES